jgi:hypothetical protein
VTETDLLVIAGSDAASQHELIAATATKVNMQRRFIFLGRSNWLPDDFSCPIRKQAGSWGQAAA